MTLALTKQQERVWRYIQSCDRSPTYTEMERDLGMLRGNLNRMIVVLKEKGYIDYKPWLARSLVALNPQTDLASYPTEALRAEIMRRQFA